MEWHGCRLHRHPEWYLQRRWRPECGFQRHHGAGNPNNPNTHAVPVGIAPVCRTLGRYCSVQTKPQVRAGGLLTKVRKSFFENIVLVKVSWRPSKRKRPIYFTAQNKSRKPSATAALPLRRGPSARGGAATKDNLLDLVQLVS